MDERTAAEWMPELYPQLCAIAQRVRARHGGGPLSPATLVHEAWLKLSRDGERKYEALHFRATAARAIRQVLVDEVRRRGADKRGGDREQVTWVDLGEGGEPVDLLALDAALTGLTAVDPRAADMVVLRFFGGLSNDEIAAQLGVSERTVKNDWRAARAWLLARLRA